MCEGSRRFARHLQFGLWLLAACDARGVELAGTRAALREGASTLWGDEGELFDARGRLMDWSYAGYRAGEAELPVRAATIDVRERGAKGDGAIDDTAALTAALAEAKPGDVVYLPAGTYVLKQPLELPDGVVLQGAGSAETVLDVPVSLTDLFGNPGLEAGNNSSYAFGGAFIEASGSDRGGELAQVTAAAQRGDTFVKLSTTAGLSAGQWIHIDQTDVNGDLMDRLHGDLQESGSGNVGDQGMEHYTRVKAVRDGGIELERALPVDVDTAWSPTVSAFDPSRQEVGVEGLTVRFPETSYPGHFKEQGYNAIELKGVFHSWVRDVRVVNGDYGVSIAYSHFVSVKDVAIDSTNGRSGHHALNCGHGGDNLFVGFDVRTPFVHDLTVEWSTTGNVFSEGKGKALSLDHHRAAPYTNLFTELHLGTGKNAWKSGGSGNRGPHAAAYSTLWNVRADADMALPPDDYGPRMTFVGFGTAATGVSSSLDWWFEDIAPADVHPQNLWRAMRERRLGNLPEPSDDGGTPPPERDDAGVDDPDQPAGDADAAVSADAGVGELPAGDGDGSQPGDPGGEAGEGVRGGCAVTRASEPEGTGALPALAVLGVLGLGRRRRGMALRQ